MDLVYFSLRHTPFWAVPLLYIGVQFFYLYWVRDFRRVAAVFFCLAVFSSFMIAFYYIAGGPELTVKFVQQLLEKWF